MPPPMPEKGTLARIQWALYRIRDNMISPCIKARAKTHVANATGRDIWVLCDGDRKYMNRMTGNFQTIFGKGEVEVGTDVYYKANSVGFTKIKSGRAIPFELHHNGVIYVSIRDDVYRTICDCFPIGYDESVIVGAGGYIYRTKYKETWIDKDEVNHEPKPIIEKQPSLDDKSEDPSEKSEGEMKNKADEPVVFV